MSNVLSQEEVDSLLKGVSSGEIETEPDSPESEDVVVAYDFTRQEQMLRNRMPSFGMVTERFATTFRTDLSAMVRKTVDIEAEPVDMVKFEDYRLSLPVPTSLHIFRVDPLVGQALVVLDGRLVFSLIECYFGGKGTEQVKIEGRDFTPIENAMIRKAVRICLEDLAAAWERIFKVKMTYVRSEVNPEFATIVMPGDLVIVNRFNIDIEGIGGNMSVCIPYSTIEPIRNKFCGGLQGDQVNSMDAKWERRLHERIRETTVDVVVELGTAKITAERLLDVKVGDVIQLEQYATQHLICTVQGVPKLEGRPGIMRGSRAIRIEKLNLMGEI
ncbi:MAG: flagellar motor switch protein FliM [Deltaproteobacteria bacterium]|nr:flagellar motor switch protein FliM [Deltaproteobacteria bacterium]